MPQEQATRERDASAGDGEMPTPVAPTSTPQGGDDLSKIKGEAAERRIKLKAAESELSKLRAEIAKRDEDAKAAESRRLGEQGEWKKLAEQAREELALSRQQQEALRGKIREASLQDHLLEKLAGLGQTGPRARLIVKAVRSDLAPTWGDDDRPTGDYEAALKAAVEALGVPATTESKPPVQAVNLTGFSQPSDSPLGRQLTGVAAIRARMSARAKGLG